MSALCRGAKWQLKLCQFKSKGLNLTLTTHLGISAPACPGHLWQAPVSSVQTAQLLMKQLLDTPVSILSSFVGQEITAIYQLLYITHMHSEGQNFWGAMKNQYRYSIVVHHHKRYKHMHRKVGKATVSRGREGPGVPKGLSSKQTEGLGPSVTVWGWRVTEGRELSPPVWIDGSSRAGKQGGCLCSCQ